LSISALLFASIATGSTLSSINAQSSDEQLVDAIQLKKPILLDGENDSELPIAVKGQSVSLVFSLEQNAYSASPDSAVVIMEIRKISGITLFTGQESIHFDSSRALNVTFHWLPESLGNYEIRMIALSSLEEPQLLSDLLVSSIRVGTLEDAERAKLEAPTPITQDTPETPAKDDESNNIGVQGRKVDYTVLVYMVASTLESNGYHATKDLEEMQEVGSSPRVNVIVETGGSLNSTIDDQRSVDFTKVQRHLVLKDKLKTIENVGDRNMADEYTLSEFIGWGITKYPAEKYVILLWDHGAGLQGFGYDDIYNDTLSLTELENALRVGKDSGHKFEIIGFDACLMASLEVANRISWDANYLVASEELEPAWGWNYSAILASLNDNPEQDGKSLGKVIADSYMLGAQKEAALYENYDSQRSLTLSVIALEKMPAVVKLADRLGDYFDARIGDQHDYYKISKAMRATERYGEGGRTSSGHLDLYHFVKNVDIYYPELSGTTKDLKAAIDEAIVYEVKGNARPDAHGVSMFMQVDEYEGNAPYLQYITGSWVSVLEKGREQLDNDNLPPVIDLHMKQDGNNTAIVGKIEGEDASKVTLYFTKDDPDNRLRINIMSIVDQDISNFVNADGESVHFVWDKKLASLCNDDEQDCQPTSIWLENNGDTSFAFIPARLESDRFNGTLVLIYVARTEGQDRVFDFIGGWPGIDEHGNAARDLVPLVPGDRLYTSTYRLSYDPVADKYYNDNVEGEDAIVVGEGFGPAYYSYPGDYQIVVSACDLADNCEYTSEFKFHVD